MNGFDWIPFYEELANKLLEYKSNKQELFRVIKNLIHKNERLSYLGMEDETRWEYRNYEIDPFSIFAIFNRNLSVENRIALVKIIANEFDIKSQIPNNFNGVPLKNSQKAVFGGNDEIWELFEQAIICSKNNVFNDEFYNYFESSINAKNNGLASITMGLFWIRPNMFLNLDSLNKSFLCNKENKMLSVIDVCPDILQDKIPSGKQYIAICNECQKLFDTGKYEFSNFYEMSYCAYINSKSTKIENLEIIEVIEVIEVIDDSISKAEFLKWFTPLIKALKDLGGNATPREVKVKIAENENLSYEVINETRGKSNVKKFDNEVAFARNYLVYEKIILSSERGIWKLSPKGYEIDMTEKIASDIFSKWVKIFKNRRDTKDLHIPVAYFVGSTINNENMTNEFIEDSRWENGYSDKYIDLIKNIQVGDKIALKSTFTQKNNLPFESNKKISAMRIKAIGTVTKNHLDGKNLDVDWEDIEERDWYFFTGRQTIWKVEEKEDDWLYKALLEFTFKYIPQDYDKFLDRYGSVEDDLINDAERHQKAYVPYSQKDFLQEVFMHNDNYETLKNLLLEKKNIILQGSPGVGKTYIAKRLAYSIIGEKDSNRVKLIQFHQSYSYEDFIMGYRPCENGFELRKGVFYNFCKTAQQDIENDYFFIIDEINRGNLSKIFGELFMLIENDKRNDENSIELIYSDEQFYVPQNIHIIGMMNTADRSLAIIDYALRRRFAFFDIKPAFKSDLFKEYQLQINNSKYNDLINEILALNIEINNDISLGSGFEIGHSYFVAKENMVDKNWLNRVVEYELIPILQEYWFDEIDKVNSWGERLKEAIL